MGDMQLQAGCWWGCLESEAREQCLSVEKGKCRGWAEGVGRRKGIVGNEEEEQEGSGCSRRMREQEQRGLSVKFGLVWFLSFASVEVLHLA